MTGIKNSNNIYDRQKIPLFTTLMTIMNEVNDMVNEPHKTVWLGRISHQVLEPVPSPVMNICGQHTFMAHTHNKLQLHCNVVAGIHNTFQSHNVSKEPCDLF